MALKRVQAATFRCKVCGAQGTVTRTATAFEFEEQCPNGHRSIVSWFHGAEPPEFEGDGQLPLFAGEGC